MKKNGLKYEPIPEKMKVSKSKANEMKLPRYHTLLILLLN